MVSLYQLSQISGPSVNKLAADMIHQLLLNLLIASPLILALMWSWYQWKNRRVLAFARKLPTVLPTIPLLGSLHNFLPNYEDAFIKHIFNNNMKTKTMPHQAKQFCIWIGPFPEILIQSPEDIQTVLNSSKSRNKADIYDLLDFAVHNDIFTGEAQVWKPIRRFLTPLFHQKNIDLLMPLLNNQGRDIVSQLSHTEERTTDVLPVISQTTVENAFNLLHGTKTPQYRTIVSQFPNSVSSIFDIWLWQFIMSFFIPGRWLLQVFRMKPINHINALFQSMNELTIKLYEEKKVAEEEDNEPADTVDPKSLVDLYSSTKDTQMFDELSLLKQFKTLVVAATDTTALTLSSCLLVLAMFPEYQEKVYQEIVTSGLLDDPNRDVTMVETKSLRYLDQFIKEVMRMFPVFPLIGRRVTEDLELSFGTVPANTSLKLALLGVHMNPDIYPEPYQFNPDRFSPDNQNLRHKFSYLPFSGGPRNCIGKDYAMISMKTSIVHIVRQFKLKTLEKMENIELYFSIELLKKNGYPISVHRRSI